jgi:hypothetical protein
MGTQATLVNPVARSNSGVESDFPTSTLGAQSGTIDLGWSGVVIPSVGTGIVSVSAQWTVPNFTPSTAGVSNCLIWVGIDGKFGSADVVLQAGVGCDFKGSAPNVYAWYEWYPDSQQKVPRSDLPVSVGDIISCTITGKLSSGTATIELRNLRPGAVPNTKSISINAESGQSLEGNCAEWVVEPIQISGNQIALCNYGSVQFSGCAAKDAKGNVLDPYDSPGGTAFKLQQHGKIVSYGSSPGHWQVTCAQDTTMGRSTAAPNTIADRALPDRNMLAQRVT